MAARILESAIDDEDFRGERRIKNKQTEDVDGDTDFNDEIENNRSITEKKTQSKPVVVLDERTKRNLRQLGNVLRTKVQAFKNRFIEEDIGFLSIDDGSKMINKREEKLGNYLSSLSRHQRVYERYMKIQRVKDKYKDRLTDVTTVWLQKFNPHIIELTSYNRAKRLAENLVRLFHNEWNEMYQTSTKKLVSRATDQQILEGLRDILKFCYQRCTDLANQQYVELLKRITMTIRFDVKTCSPILRLRMKELQKLSASYTLPFVQKDIRQTILSQSHLHTVVRVHHTQKPPFRSFLDMCTETTWFMQFQDPPIALDFSDENGLIKFKPYSEYAPILDFVVWPAVLVHEGGLIVAKGVAEFKDSGEYGFAPAQTLLIEHGSVISNDSDDY